MAHRRMNSRPVNPAYQFTIHSPPLSPNPSPNPSPVLPPKELPAMSVQPVSYWLGSHPGSPQSISSTSSKSSLDSLPLPFSSISSFNSTAEDYYCDEDEDVFIGTPSKKTTTSRNKSWLRKPLTALLTRRPRPRTTLVLLVCLSVVSIYIIFTSSSLSSQYQAISSPQDTPIYHNGSNPPPIPNSKPNLQLPTKVNRKIFKGNRPPLVLNPAEELAALTSFLIALPQNMLPNDVDGNKPIDPQLILDFDVRGGRKAKDELQVVREQVWENNPVVIYAKHYAPNTKLLLRGLLDSLNVHPPPAVFFVDERHDGDVLMQALTRISSQLTPQPLMPSLSPPPLDTLPTLPLVMIGGQLISIPYEDMTQHKDESDNAAHKIMIKTALKNAIHRAGAETREGKKKKKGH